jgi:hypothetical protein
MALAFRAVGTVSSGTASLTPGAAAGTALGDLLALEVVNKYPAVTVVTPTGWIAGASRASALGGTGVDAGDVLVSVFWRIADGTGTDAPTVTFNGTPNSATAIISCWTLSATKTTAPVFAVGSQDTNSLSWSVPFATDPGLTTNDMCVVFSGKNVDTGRVSAHTLATTGVVFTDVPMSEKADAGDTTGDDLAWFIASSLVTSGTSSGVATYTATVATTAAAGACVLMRLREQNNTGASAVTLDPFTVSSAGTVTTASTGVAYGIPNSSALRRSLPGRGVMRSSLLFRRA